MYGAIAYVVCLVLYCMPPLRLSTLITHDMICVGLEANGSMDKNNGDRSKAGRHSSGSKVCGQSVVHARACLTSIMALIMMLSQARGANGCRSLQWHSIRQQAGHSFNDRKKQSKGQSDCAPALCSIAQPMNKRNSASPEVGGQVEVLAAAGGQLRAGSGGAFWSR
jgi:hypothetical protein